MASERVPLFNIPAIIWILIAICFLGYVLPTYILSFPLQIRYYDSLAFMPALFTAQFERGFDPWSCLSLVTYSFLHGGWMHLLLNMLWLVVFGAPLAARLGALRMVAFWCVTGVLAALAYYIFFPESQVFLVGASGAISGMIGGAARFGFYRGFIAGQSTPAYIGSILSIKQSLLNRTVLFFIIIWLAMNFISGVQSSGTVAPIAWQAHIGGLLAGFLLVGFFDPYRRLYRRR